MAKSDDKAISERDSALVRRGTTLPLGETLIPVEAIFNVPAVHPAAVGPWSLEADKIAWTDADTKYGVIIRRSPQTGHLCGFVGVGPDHPLYGFTINAIQAVGVHAHGSIDYAEPCQQRVPEQVSVCHVSEDRGQAVPQNAYANAKAEHGDDAWWIGFSCNQVTDVLPVPTGDPHAKVPAPLAGIVSPEYRDVSYVYDQCMSLVLQLEAIEAGTGPEPHRIETPAIGLYPSRKGA